jgi:hypothetical protein
MGEIQSLLGHANERTTSLYLYWQAEIDRGATVLDEMGNLVGIEHVARTRAPALALPAPPEIIPPSLPEPRPYIRNGVVVGVRHSREKVLEIAIDRHVNGKEAPRVIARAIGGISEGTIKKLLVEAGVYDPSVWLDSPERIARQDRIVNLYETGMEVKHILREVGTDIGTLYKTLRAQRVRLRGRGRQMEDEAKRAAVAVKMYRRGTKVPEIARLNRVKNGRVYGWLREAGIKLRRPAPPPPRKMGRERTEHAPSVINRAIERYRNGDNLTRSRARLGRRTPRYTAGLTRPAYRGGSGADQGAQATTREPAKPDPRTGDPPGTQAGAA